MTFTAWPDKIADKSGQAIVAIDGKTVRGSFDKQNETSAIHIVNAWISNNSLILGQLKTSSKSNEITVIPELLDMLLVKGCIITIDAMGCQKDIAEKIIDKKADYVLALKGNQPTLFNNKLYLDAIYHNVIYLIMIYHIKIYFEQGVII